MTSMPGGSMCEKLSMGFKINSFQLMLDKRKCQTGTHSHFLTPQNSS